MGAQIGWSTRWRRLAILVLIVLTTIGAWEVFKGMAMFGGFAHADGIIGDHLTCYDLGNVSAKAPDVAVQLIDQFNPAPTGQFAEVKGLKLLCTMALKTRLSSLPLSR